VRAEFGSVEILVNAAGITLRVPTIDCSEETWQRIFDTNLTGTLRTCQIFGRTMLEQGRGSIINIASLSSFVAFHEVAAYGASKAGVAALTRSLAIEFAPKNVRVNGIAPGIFPTDLPWRGLDAWKRSRARQCSSHPMRHRSLRARFSRWTVATWRAA
jgi:NAD(P)-dependent dehydrogenase (short-subunit alcohol dehydrogenase family)